jgi:prepilin-type N-terminal cleavage/methylation domain-containing protein
MSPSSPDRRSPSGFSLTELLIASTIALVVMGAVAQLFSLFSRTLSESQAIVDIGGRMRTTALQLRHDLAGVTVPVQPGVGPESSAGYFELIEGPRHDSDAAHGSSDLEADSDDVLLFTTRSSGRPFVGQYGAEKIESPVAEVAWFCRQAASQPVNGTTLYNLHRRQLLVVGYVGRPPFSLAGANSMAGSLPTADYDISLRAENGMLVPNTLGDLTKRENRFRHVSGTFPHVFILDDDATFDNTTRVWEDVILTNVLGFDVRVYDPLARAMPGTTTSSLMPGESAYVAAAALSGTGALGAYVDLGWGGGAPMPLTVATSSTLPPNSQSTWLQTPGFRVSNGPKNAFLTSATNATIAAPTYDTWSLHYESNGIDEDGDGTIDEGTNLVDDNADALPDNPPERETSAPYPVPLRGIEVRIRCYEPTSRQVRQATLRHTFVGE